MLVSLCQLSFGYDDVNILNDLTLSINEGDRIGFIGENGAGKSTLLKIITGELGGYVGEIRKKSGLVIGFLAQNGGLESDNTVWQEAISVFAPLLAAENRLRMIESEMTSVDPGDPAYARLVSEYERLNDVTRAGDVHTVDVRVRTVLNGMGFSAVYDRSVNTLSGGEKTRLALCKLLLAEPELLILDEPTNHLDVATLGWLEKYLESYKKALLIVSHDRFFLDRTVRKIWELERTTVTEFRGNYTKFKELKEEYVKTRLREYEKQQIKIKKMSEYAERNIARASTSNSAKSRLHQLANIQEIEAPVTFTKKPVFRFSIKEESAKEVVKVVDLPLAIDDKTLVPKLSFTVNRGDRVALVGANGTGKSTLIKTMLGLVGGEDDGTRNTAFASSVSVGERAVLRGVNCHVLYGKDVSISYYDQENDNLNPDNTVLSELWFRFTLASQTDIRASLAAALLTAEDMDKKVSALSGGERAKLGLVVVKEEHSNLLFLDEPTNHLDLSAREALEKGLKEYTGTVFFVSHDRYFINALANRVIELSSGKAEFFAGNYDDYITAKERATVPEEKDVTVKKVTPTSGFRSKEVRKSQVRLKTAIAECEKSIAEKEDEKSALYDEMCSGKADYKRLKIVEDEYHAVEAELEKLYAEWERLSEELESLG